MQATYDTPLAVRAIGDINISAVSMGCMNISHAYSAPLPDTDAERVLLSALDAGMTMFDTATLYGFGSNETLMGKVMSKHRSKFMLASKCAMGGEDVNGDGKLVRVIDGSPANIKRQCELSLKRLKTDVIDLYYLHRWDKQVPIEDSTGALADLVREGKIRHIGLSEVSAHRSTHCSLTNRILAVDSQPGNCRAASLSRAGHYLCSLQPSWQRIFRRQDGQRHQLPCQ
jgi:aryl-alcohol dehydrogenase-like predicted oxidoreductase